MYKMRPEIEALKKLAAGTINKGRLAAIRAAQAKANELLNHLEPKPDDEDAAQEFEDVQSQAENALQELEFACDDLEGAEEKEDRETACEQIEEWLGEAITNLESIMEVAVISAVKPVATEEEDIARVRKILSLPQEERARAVLNWLGSSPTPEIKQRRLKALRLA